MADKKIFFAILMVILVGLLTYRLLNPYQQPTVAQLTYTGETVSGKALALAEASSGKGGRDQNDLLLELYVNPPRHSAGTLKNVFSPSPPKGDGERPSVPPPPAAVTEDEKEPVIAAAIPAGLGNISVFGFYKNQKDEVLFIERGKDILTVRQGDRIDGKYLVKTITDTSMVVTVNGDEIVVDFDI